MAAARGDYRKAWIDAATLTDTTPDQRITGREGKKKAALAAPRLRLAAPLQHHLQVGPDCIPHGVHHATVVQRDIEGIAINARVCLHLL
jgi:hypothetical protein